MIAAFVPDLMDRSRFGSADVQFVGSPADVGAATLVVVDLDRCRDLDGFGALGVRTIGFCSHVDGERLARGRAAGFDEVVARSVLFRRLPALLADPGRAEPGGG